MDAPLFLVRGSFSRLLPHHFELGPWLAKALFCSPQGWLQLLLLRILLMFLWSVFLRTHFCFFSSKPTAIYVGVLDLQPSNQCCVYLNRLKGYNLLQLFFFHCLTLYSPDFLFCLRPFLFYCWRARTLFSPVSALLSLLFSTSAAVASKWYAEALICAYTNYHDFLAYVFRSHAHTPTLASERTKCYLA